MTVSSVEIEEEGLVANEPPRTTTDAQGVEVPVVPDKGFDHNPGTPEGKDALTNLLRDRAVNLGITRFEP